MWQPLHNFPPQLCSTACFTAKLFFFQCGGDGGDGGDGSDGGDGGGGDDGGSYGGYGVGCGDDGDGGTGDTEGCYGAIVGAPSQGDCPKIVSVSFFLQKRISILN